MVEMCFDIFTLWYCTLWYCLDIGKDYDNDRRARNEEMCCTTWYNALQQYHKLAILFAKIRKPQHKSHYSMLSKSLY